MDFIARQKFQFDTAMPTSWIGPFDLVLQIPCAKRRGYQINKINRPNLHDKTFSRKSTHQYHFEKEFWHSGQSETYSTPNAEVGNSRNSSRAQYKPPAHRSRCISVFAERFGDRLSESRMECGYHVYQLGPWLWISGSNHGLVQSLCVVMETFKQLGNYILFGGTRRCAKSSQAQNFQFRSGMPIYQHGFYKEIARQGNSNQHGFQGARFRQYLCGKTMANGQVRRCVYQRLRIHERGADRAEEIFSILQQQTLSSITQRSNADGRLYKFVNKEIIHRSMKIYKRERKKTKKRKRKNHLLLLKKLS